MHPQTLLKTLYLVLLVAATSCKASSNAGENSNAVSASANVFLETHSETPTEPSKSNLKSKELEDESTIITEKPKRKKPKKQASKKISKAKTIHESTSQASATLRRIKKEYKDAVEMGIAYDWSKGCPVKSKSKSQITEHHPPALCVGPLATNLRHWHFSFKGCGMYGSGLYHGRILLPKDYPAAPPRVQLWTPSGRFVPYHDICLSASSYHPESWTPRWTVLSLVQALRLHMLTNPQEIGGMTSSTQETYEYAKQSLVWKLAWKVGKVTIQVDHGEMIRQGVILLQDEEEEVDLRIPPQVTESKGAKEKKEELETSEAADNNESGIMVPDDKPQSGETVHTVNPGVEQIPVPQAAPQESGQMEVTARSKKVPKQKRSSQGSVATTRQRIRAPTKKKGASYLMSSVILVISKLFATPARVALLSFLLLLWLLNIP
jgi:ubiquitin-protein ligase